MKIIGIVAATDKCWAIGKKNGLLFSLTEDMLHFRQTTINHFVVMGINTVNSLPNGKPLKGRITICIDQDKKPRDDCFVVSSTEECLKLMEELAPSEDTEFYICGGGYCYKSFLDYYDSVIVTKVYAEDPEATVFFPNLDEDKRFKITKKSDIIKDGDYEIKFVTYERIKNNGK